MKRPQQQHAAFAVRVAEPSGAQDIENIPQAKPGFAVGLGTVAAFAQSATSLVGPRSSMTTEPIAVGARLYDQRDCNA